MRIHLQLAGNWGRAALLYAVTLLAYGPAIPAGFIWNDRDYVTAPQLRSWEGLGRIWTEPGVTEQYYPLLHSAFWLEYRLWGDSPTGYHLANILLHASAAVLLAGVVRRLRLPGPWIAAFLFALHPVCVESVAWIAEQKNTLSTFFCLAAAWLYLRFDDTRSPRSYTLALGCFICALLAKSVTATLAPALLVLFWWRRGRLRWRQDVVPLLPWFGLGTAMGLFSAWFEHTVIGAQGSDFELGLLERALLAGRVAWFYLSKLGWPGELIFIYPRWTVTAADPVWYLGLAATLGLLASLFWIRHRARGPLAAVLCYGGALFPTLGFFNVYAFKFSYVADHWQYLAAIAILVPAGAGLSWAAGELNRRRRGVGTLVVIGLFGALGFLTLQQSRMYRDIETFYRVTLARNPECWMAHNNLGQQLADRGATDEALVHYTHALRLRPDYAEAHNNMGALLAARPGRQNDALNHFRQAIELNPKLAAAHHNLAIELAKQGQSEQAFAQYEQALALQPFNARIHHSFAAELAKHGNRRPDAQRHYEAAIRFDPEFADPRVGLANLLAELPDRLEEAVAHYEVALQLRPHDAQVHNNLANALARLPGRMPDAIDHYYRALEITPDSAVVHYNLGRKLAQLPGRTADAVRHLEAAARAAPSLAVIHYELARQLAQVPGRERDAIAAFETTLRLDPALAAARNELAALQARLRSQN